MIVGSYQIENTGTGSEDSRMFFDVSNSAYRAGSAAGVEWDYASSGQYSTAFGQGTVASGDGSTAMGTFTVASGNGSVAMGGLGATASGSGSVAMGGFSRAIGGGSVAIGNIARATETYSVAIGSNATASGYASTAMGRQTTASGTQSAALGSYASAGAYAMAIGLSSTAPGTHPVVTGQQSLGIFMGNQNAVDLSSVNTMGLFGGSMVIDPAVPATNLSPDTALEIEGTLKIAYGGEACDVAREGAIRFVSASNSFAFCANNANDWETVSLGAGTLAALSDTTIAASPANGQVLYYSGSVWISNRLAINDLSDGTADYTSGNLFLGQGVVNASTTGANNVVVGTSAADSMTSGQRNVILGSEVAEDLTTGHSSVLLGYRTASAVTGGYQNVAIGAYSGQNMSYNNTYLGERAGRDGAGNNNTMIGRVAGMGVTSGNNNVILGSQSESAIFASGSNNILLGAMIDTPQAATSNYLNLGNIFYGSMGTGELYIGSNGALRMPVGGDAQRPGTVVGTTAVNGMLRYNSASDRFEGYQGGSWQDILTGAIAGGAAAPDRGIQFNSGGSFHASSGLVYSSTGNLGVGASDPQTRLVVSDNTSSLPYVPYDEALARFVNENSVSPAVMVEGFARQSLLRLMRADGTAAAPTAVTAGKLLGSMAFFGYDGVNYSSNASARMRARAAEDFSVGSMGTSLEFMTTSLGEGNAEKRIVIDGNGNIGMGSDIDYASARLHVDGTLKIAYGGEACDADREGAIRFVSASNSFAFCADTGNDWETVSLGAGVTEIDDLSDAATNYTSGSMYIGQGAPYTATGIDNTTLGLDAGTGLTSGASNTLIGAYAGEALTTQISNTAVGTYVLNANTGNYNTSVGNFSLVQSLGASNTALGSSAATNLINGNDNVFIGELAGRGDNTGFTWDGAENVIIGQNAAVDLDGTNNQNTIIGSDTAATLTGGGSGNILLGYGVDVPSATTSNYINIGNVIYGSADTGYSRVAGTFQISSSGEACDAAREGAMQYGSGGSNIFEVCADSANGWEQLALGGTVAGALNDLSDVNTAGFADGDLLLYSAGASAWVPGDAPLVGAFTDLTDTPANYTGQGGRFAVVNAGETALEFSDTLVETVTGEPLPDTINLNDLGDASVSGATDGQYLTYDSASGNWVAGTISSSSVSAAGADSQIQFNSGGEFAASADLVFTSAGRLGLGTSSPGQNLHISDAGIPGLLFTDTSSSTQAGFALSGNNFTIFQTSFGSEQLLNIDLVTNNVGINNVSPIAALDIGGDIKFASSSLACDSVTHEGAMQFGSGGSNIFEVCANSATGWEQLALGGTVSGALDDLSDVDVTGVTDGQFLAYNAGATDWVAVDNPGLWTDSGAGYIEYSSTLGGIKVASVTGAAAPSGATKSVILSAGDISAAGADSQIQFNSGGDFAANANFVFTSAGRLGLGTSAPVSVFDVAGDIRFASSSLACNSATHEGAMQFGSGGSNIFEVCANSATGWEQLALGGTVSGALDDLSDVNTTGFADGNVLLYSAGASAWVPGDAQLVGAFTDLTDTPANYTGQGGRFAVVNAGETALEFSDTLVETVTGEPLPDTINLNDLGDASVSGATDGQYLTYDSASGNWVAGTISSSSVSAAGADSQIQFNSGGGFAANANFVYTSAGLLGLGTSTPSTALDININQNDITSISVTNTNAGIGSAVAVGLVSNAGAVMMGQGSAAGGGLSSIGASSLGGLRIFSESATADMYFETGDGPTTGRRMEIDSSGLVRFTSSGAVRLPVGDTSEQPSTPQNGMIRYNTDNDRFEGYQGGSWQDIVTGSLSGGSAAAPNRGIQFNSADSFAADATFTYTSAGNLGVGTATPGVKLDVVGDIRTSNNLILQPVSGLAAPTYISAGYFALNNLTDVDTTGFADGNVLLYSAGASGWIPGTVSGGGGGALNDLSDATTVYPSGNMYIGQGAGAGATTAINMTAVGINALASNTVSNFATAIGAYAAENAIASTQWSAIVAVGSEAGRNVGSTGGFTAIGNEALKDFAGERNTAVGNIAMFTGPSGGGNDNTGVGDGVGAYMSGDRNTLLGTSAFRGGFGGDYDHAGDDNVIIGYNAAMNVQGATTSNNVIIGTNTAAALRNGSSNLLIGNDVDVSGANAANEMNIGDVIYASGLYNATTHLGINNATPNVELDVTGDIEYTGTITDVSDRRLKTDITPLNTDEMMAKIAQINTYKFRMKDDPKGRIEFGVMAQELEEQFPELVKTANDEMGTKSVNYVGLITPLIEVSKELKSENDTLRAELAEMKTAQAKFEADIMQQVNGLKAHTGYGISKAQMGLWMLVIMFGSLSLWFVIGGMVRNRQNKQL